LSSTLARSSSGRIATLATRQRITEAIGTILAEGARTESLRADVDPEDVTAMLLGAFFSTAAGNASQQTSRLLDLVFDALRPPTGGRTSHSATRRSPSAATNSRQSS
jgi:hypothetical protein